MTARDSNVVRLPTAAPRQVQQRWNKHTRAARAALREAAPWPGEYIFPGERAAMKLAERLVGIQETPALAIVMAMVGTLDDNAKLRLIGDIAKAFGPSAREAIALVESSRRTTVGQQMDLMNALARLRGER